MQSVNIFSGCQSRLCCEFIQMAAVTARLAGGQVFMWRGVAGRSAACRDVKRFDLPAARSHLAATGPCHVTDEVLSGGRAWM